MFREAVKYPTEVEDEVREYGIGILLHLGSIFLIPAFFLLGYFVKVVSQTLDGSEQIPRFENFTGLFIDGLKFTGILLTYIFIPVFLASFIETIGTESAANIAVLPLMLTTFYLTPSAIVNFARNDRMLSAFNLREVGEKAFRLKYLKGIFVLAGTALLITLAQLVALFVLIITIIGIPALIVAIPAMRFYENLVYFRMMAKIAD